MSASTPLLGTILASFFNDHLRLQRGLRPNSITSDADAMRLLLQFAAATGQQKVTQLGLDDLTAEVVCRFLKLPRRDPKQCGSVAQPAIGGAPHVLRIHRPAIPREAGTSSEGGRYSEKARSASGNHFS